MTFLVVSRHAEILQEKGVCWLVDREVLQGEHRLSRLGAFLVSRVLAMLYGNNFPVASLMLIAQRGDHHFHRGRFFV